MQNTMLWLLVVLMNLFMACACNSSDSEDLSDGDITDGDATDGDISDGDTSDGDTGDGDTTDGDVTDGDQTPSGTYIIISEDALADAAGELGSYRAGQGYDVVQYKVSELVSLPAQPGDLQVAIHELLSSQSDADDGYLLLVGKAPEDGLADGSRIPAMACSNMYGDCFTDNRYGDLDNDSIPEVAIGRLPFRTAEEISAYISKVQAAESEYNTGLWNRRLAVWAGEAGFGPEIDGLLEMLVFTALEQLNHSFDVVGAYANSASAYYYSPLEEKVLDFFNDGAVLTVYIGHGSTGGTDGLEVESLSQIDCQNRKPFAFFFACLNGNYTSDRDSIAEEIIKLPDGPITAVGGSDITHPYGNAVLPYELQRAVLDIQPPTIGKAFRLMKEAAILHEDNIRGIIDSSASSVDVAPEEQDQLCREHNDLYNLFGDPAAAIRYPKSTLTFDDAAIGGSVSEKRLDVSGNAPCVTNGTIWVTLETKRNEIHQELEDVDPYFPDEATVQRNWAKAVDLVIAGKEVPVTDGQFSTTLSFYEDLPTAPHNTYYLKAYAEDGVNDCFGYTKAPNTSR